MRAMIRRFVRDEEAATAIEYALIAGLIAVVIAGALTPIGDQIKTILENILTALTPTTSG
ncbi:MAG: Flp family type IVb pilin [Gammaproteobacteria bacterium]|nr:Flp family type IVb pilin [Gammaproteobacteria bacterium]